MPSDTKNSVRKKSRSGSVLAVTWMLYGNAAMLSPVLYLLPEEMTRQSVHLSHVAAARVRFSVEIVRCEMIASRYENAVKVALFARHSMQRLERRQAVVRYRRAERGRE